MIGIGYCLEVDGLSALEPFVDTMIALQPTPEEIIMILASSSVACRQPTFPSIFLLFLFPIIAGGKPASGSEHTVTMPSLIG